MNNNNTRIGFTGLLTLVFITLKLTHFIDWYWWWVLSPIWISALLLLGFLACGGIMLLGVAYLTWRSGVEADKRRAQRREINKRRDLDGI